MRIWSGEVMQDIEGVLEAVLTALEREKAPSP
jgi:very-short-patch-repair endonuclease